MTLEATQAWHRANPNLSRTLGKPMPHINQMLTSKYLSKHDLASPIIAHIRGVALDSGGRNNEDPRWLMYFSEVRKPMRMNNTILRYLAETIGPNSDTWIGKKVKVYVDHSIMMAGQVVGGVRLQVAKSQILSTLEVSRQLYDGAGGKAPGGSGGPVFAGNATLNVPTAGAGAPPAKADNPDFDPVTGEFVPPADPDFDDDINF